MQIKEKQIQLAFQRFKPRSPSKPADGHKPLVILHGLFGSKQNWRSLSKGFKINLITILSFLALSDALDTEVLSMDLRNHGESPWINEPMSYKSMAFDVAETVKKSFGPIEYNVMGHSMVFKMLAFII
jgi:pimeloyl-ACP methyl ester carboxylesterase